MSAIVTEQEMDRRRKLRAARVKLADKHGIALGWISEDLTVMKQANGQEPPKLPKPPRDAA